MFLWCRKAPCCGGICGLSGDRRLCGGALICGENGLLKPCTGHGFAEKLWKKPGLIEEGMPG